MMIIQGSLGSWVLRTPAFGTTIPKNSKSNSTYMDTGAFHDWQLSAETSDGLLPSPHQMVQYGAGFPTQNSSGVLT